MKTDDLGGWDQVGDLIKLEDEKMNWLEARGVNGWMEQTMIINEMQTLIIYIRWLQRHPNKLVPVPVPVPVPCRGGMTSSSIGRTSRCARLPCACSRRSQMTSDPSSRACGAPIRGTCCGVSGNLIRISQASCCPGTAFFFPAAFNYWTVKGWCWAGRRFNPPANERGQIRGQQPPCMETWTPTAGTDLQTCTVSGASVSTELESSRMTQDFTWKPDWTFHWLH